ncbi:MAG: bifunctional glutamate N-acetyltransferase/amino-acid acetyltransferase ArgJ [Candidatus Omnitrophica bacterium]|nr:bifunctional glutamate N-acetyltransferase/amino-acid acetyltransferase ArgJ [Candidatus Omnitrophota bacterium]
MKVIKGGVTTPKGFKANGFWAGVKKSGKPDLGLVFSQSMCSAAAVFTRSSVKAAPIVVCQENIHDGRIQALIANSGNANCFTGEYGFTYARKMTELVAEELGIGASSVLVMSTGIIGRPFPYEKFKEAVPKLVRGLGNTKGASFAKAIMTTDLKDKQIAVSLELDGKLVTIGGCAKGSGMIEPNMATMLACVTTDAAISSAMLKEALLEAVDVSFNSITVDGCMSTNDMLSVMANGLAGNKKISSRNAGYRLFLEALTVVCVKLAKDIVLDGEGAERFFEIRVTGAETPQQAKAVAKKIANSNLVKTADYTDNPNWGRVAAAIGACETRATETSIKISFSVKKNNIFINADLGLGAGAAVVYTCDLTREYVDINGKYN